MELKVLCDCGQKFKFDVEPVGGLMPFQVNCPSCGVDRTGTANEMLARPPVAATTTSTVIPVPTPVPAVPVASATSAPPIPVPVTAAAPPAPAAGGGLRINRPAPSEPPTPPPVSAASTSPAAPPPRRPIGMTAPAAIPKYMQTNKATQNNNFFMGMLGGFIGAIVGFLLYLGFSFLVPFILFSIYIKLVMGAMIGSCSGYGARIFYKGTDMTLGGASALITLLVVGGFFLLAGMLVPLGIFGMLHGLIITGAATCFAFKIASG